LSAPLVVLVGWVLLSGCGGQEQIPLKKVDFVLDDPPKDYKEKRQPFAKARGSAKIGRDPSGMSPSN
jgi:hypothetical protein